MKTQFSKCASGAFAGVMLSVGLVTLTARAHNPSFRVVQTVVELDSDGDGMGATNYVVNYGYEHGNVVRSAVEVDFNLDGVLDERSTSIRTFDKHGNLIFREGAAYSLPDGTLRQRSRTTYTYDHHRLVTTLTEADSNADGTVDLIIRTSLNYDGRGNLVRRFSEADQDGNGTWDAGNTQTLFYDRRGDLLSDARESDGNLDGVVDSRVTTTYIREAHGHATLVVTEFDFDADGIAEETATTSNLYDRRGNLASATTEYADADGFVYAVIHTIYTYDVF